MVGDFLQPTHLLFVLIVALLVLGPKRLPEVGRALGRGLRDFRSAISGEETREEAISPPQPPLTDQHSPLPGSDPSPTSAQPSPEPTDTAQPEAQTEVQAPR